VKIEQGGAAVLSGLVPGPYRVSIDKPIRVSGLEDTVRCDCRTVELAAGETELVEFVRKVGAGVTGRVVLGEGGEGKKSVVLIREAATAQNPEVWAAQAIGVDVLETADDGRFETALLEPGEYVALARVWTLPARMAGFADHGSSGGWLTFPEFPPTLIGTASFTVPETGEPEPLTIELVRHKPK